MRNELPGNVAVTSLDALNAIIRTRLKRMQCQPDLITSFLNETGLPFEPAHPWRFDLSSRLLSLPGDAWLLTTYLS